MPGLGLQTNLGALTAISNLGRISRAMHQSIGRLSSGLRIQSAADDPAGFAIAARMDARLRGSRQALRNVHDAISLLQTAEGGYQTQSDLLRRMRELSVQAASDGISDDERDYLDAEFQLLEQEMARVAITGEFNGIDLLGAAGLVSTLTFQVGPGDGDAVTVDLPTLDPSVLGLGTANLQDVVAAGDAIEAVDGAIQQLNEHRAALGSEINLMTLRADHLTRAIENQAASLSQIRDVDMARESAELAKQQVLQQAAVARLAQANATPSLILRLLG